ncbi:glycosyltransferase family 4 protein [Acidimangrovimonas sediminis]|uniref:glycosyltransferase family 4 protein n=1 Tax=Acidimangrovimonas sediminis TaxID=2056283 RepID=UPI000C808820|nr:glycosyltransferase family 1 protein [Acidimangrovimonas sediminis]
MTEIVYDLTEVFLASTGKLRYYGILRVVAEIGAGLRRLDPSIRYCVYSYALDDFVEVFPELHSDGQVDLKVPQGVKQLRLRQKYYTPNPLRDLLLVPLRRIARKRNLKAWDEAGLADMPRIDLQGRILVSCGRPKLMADQFASLDRKGVHVTFIPLLHDMIPLHEHFNHKRKSFKGNFIHDNRNVLSRARLVLSNSAFTRDEIISFGQSGHLPTPPEVIPIPLVHECPEGTEPAEGEVPQEPFLMAVGASIGRKNLDVVFAAMARLAGEGKPVPLLILAGAPRDSVRKYLEDERFAAIRDRVIFRKNPNQTDLVALYRGALALVIASRMEGWGLPAGEALWLGTPAICSTAPVFREVCGDLGLYFDPDDPEALAGIVNRLMTDTAYRDDLRARIAAAHDTLRDWMDVSRDVLAAIAPVAKAG